MWTSRFSREKNPKNEQKKTCQTSLDRSWGVGELKGFRQTYTPKIPASFFISLQTIHSEINYMDTAGENAHSGRLQTVTKNATWRSDDDRCVLQPSTRATQKCNLVLLGRSLWSWWSLWSVWTVWSLWSLWSVWSLWSATQKCNSALPPSRHLFTPAADNLC